MSRSRKGAAAGTGPGSPSEDTGVDHAAFVEHVRSSAPYIHAHRGRTFVVVFGGALLESRGLRDFAHDLALLHSLGIRLILVAGARPQIERRLADIGREPRYVRGIRVTDDAALECVKEAAATVRVEVEALLSMGLPNSPMAGARIRVATGNFVTARPVGVVDGVDLAHTGIVRRVDAAGIRQRLDDPAIVLLTPIGYSITGEVFNISTHELAASVAVATGADKLVCLVEGRGLSPEGRESLAELTPEEAEALLAGRRLGADVRRHLGAAVLACKNGVRRAHLVPRKLDGGLLLELFTRDGVGTLVTSETFEDIRPAQTVDVPGILELIEPLEREGVLVARSHELLENDIEQFVVAERDGMIVACAALYPYLAERQGEVACVAVHPAYQKAARGDALLSYLERRSREQGMDRLFVLTTRTAHWFVERGFEPGTVKSLPKERRRTYDSNRKSKVLVKRL